MVSAIILNLPYASQKIWNWQSPSYMNSIFLQIANDILKAIPGEAPIVNIRMHLRTQGYFYGGIIFWSGN
jgi:hypothetical protein